MKKNRYKYLKKKKKRKQNKRHSDNLDEGRKKNREGFGGRGRVMKNDFTVLYFTVMPD